MQRQSSQRKDPGLRYAPPEISINPVLLRRCHMVTGSKVPGVKVCGGQMEILGTYGPGPCQDLSIFWGQAMKSGIISYILVL